LNRFGENLRFLRKMVGDGSAGATFSRMLPYGGTPIRDQLQKEGRLRGDITRPDYVFLDPRINDSTASSLASCAPGCMARGFPIN
jgi:hypothetical protein